MAVSRVPKSGGRFPAATVAMGGQWVGPDPAFQLKFGTRSAAVHDRVGDAAIALLVFGSAARASPRGDGAQIPEWIELQVDIGGHGTVCHECWICDPPVGIPFALRNGETGLITNAS